MSPSYAALFRSPYRALMVAALGATFLGSLDALMVVTALPSAAQDIGGVDLISLAVGATMVTIVMTLPLAGALIDRYGVARSFAIACVLFSAANVLGGLAPSMPVVALSRGVLGLGAGFMFAVPLGLFALYVPNELRPRAFGLNAAMWGVSALIGPALGAALTGSVGWRWVFWVNLPLIAIVAWAARLALQSHPAREPKHDRPAAERRGAGAARHHRAVPAGGRPRAGHRAGGAGAGDRVPGARAAHGRARVHTPPGVDRRERDGAGGRLRVPGRRGVPAAAAPGRIRRAGGGGGGGAGA